MRMLSRNKENVIEIHDFGKGETLKYLFASGCSYWKSQHNAWTADGKIICKDGKGIFHECTAEQSYSQEYNQNLSFFEVLGLAQVFNISKVTYVKCEAK